MEVIRRNLVPELGWRKYLQTRLRSRFGGTLSRLGHGEVTSIHPTQSGIYTIFINLTETEFNEFKLPTTGLKGNVRISVQMVWGGWLSDFVFRDISLIFGMQA